MRFGLAPWRLAFATVSPPEADIHRRDGDIRFVPEAFITAAIYSLRKSMGTVADLAVPVLSN
jgi:hypothetical protein